MYVCAESVKVDSDEGRLTLEVEDVNGERLTVDVHGIDLDAFYTSVKSGVGGYLRERDEARRTAPGTTTWTWDADTPYDLSDPKHPEFHSIHADIWDARDGK